MLEGKKIIVTGSASGMGEATLKAYVKAGANVIGMDISDEKGNDISINANSHGTGTCSFIHIDVSDKDSVKNAFDLALDELKTLDVLAHLLQYKAHQMPLLLQLKIGTICLQSMLEEQC